VGKTDVKQALLAMDDEDVRSRIADGDLSDLDQLDLSPEEREMVKNAATDYPEVAGFAMMAYFTGNTGLPKIEFSPGFNIATEYVQKY